MLKEERQLLILESLRRDGKVIASDLSQILGVSEDTIRRDLRELDNAGRLTRVHGGGLPHSSASVSYLERQRIAPEAKEAIARAAVGLVKSGQVLILDGGTTTLRVARLLPAEYRLTVITNSPPVALELAEHSRVEVIIAGGKLYQHSLVTTGAQTVDTFRQVHADLCILGVCSLHPEIGISLPDFEESLVKKAMMDSSDQVLALASREKLGTASTHRVGPVSRLTYLITEQIIPEEELIPYRQAGIVVICA